ncbi:site-specific integrase [Pseudomonas sp. HY13-MNA-CIBAN-0226]|uniref:site-specific integrase n=1 Tax=Pseudomonas sp. HY13-MNA-CIBAN-0226 TaxID=3140473 RepID=UPI0033169D42
MIATATFDTLIYQIKPVREHFVRLLSAQNVHYAWYASEDASLQQSSAVYDPVAVFNTLMSLPVSKLSVLRDPVWDFNDEAEPLARLIEGSKSKIDFTNYPNLNSTILFELKIAFVCALQMPGAIRRGDRLVTPKPHTVIEIFKSMIPFFDKMCERKRREHGDEYFELSYYSLADFLESDYIEEAKVFDRAFRRATNQGFKYLRSNFLHENLFDKPLPHVEMHTLEWKQNSVTNPKKRVKQKHFSNRVFEKCSRKATFVVVDFLRALKEKIYDQDGLERVTADGYNAAAEIKLTKKNFDIYVVIRMSSRGYTGKEIEPLLYSKDAEFWSLQPGREGMFKKKDALRLLTKANLDDDFYQYLTHVSNSAYYIIGQYTGMRPSELSGIMAEGCLVKDDFGHNLILSTVIKNRELAGKLFGDKWAAIPIVMDAVRTLQILNRFKQNPYLISNMNTIALGEKDKANSIGDFTYVLCAFLAKVLDFEELESLDVSAYTLRHSLAHQMMRAAVGLPFVSYQLKHFGNVVGAIGQHRMSAVTIDYGGIGDALTADGGRSVGRSIRHEAELELIQNTCDPDGSYVGEHAGAYRERLKKYYQGYIEAGYTKEEIFDRMVENDFAIINVGQGFCYGEATEEFDVSVPCIGSLRCNPNRCKNAFVTKANAPKWREVYVQNTIALKKIESSDEIIHGDIDKSVAQLKAAIAEARAVLEGLGEELVV